MSVVSNWGVLFLIIILVVSLVVVPGIVVLIVFTTIKKKRIQQSEIAASNKVEESTSDLAKAFGSKSNIKRITSSGSRVTVELVEISKVNTDKIKEIYKDVLFTNNKAVFVVGEKSKEFASQLENKLNK